MTAKRTRKTPKQRAAKHGKKQPTAGGAATGPAAAKQHTVFVLEPSPPTPLRGILPTPPEVAKIVVRELEGHPVTDREKQRITDCFKLQYYFGGQWIAYRDADQGKEVLAVGMDEIGRLKRKHMPAAAREKIVLRYCDPWYYPGKKETHTNPKRQRGPR